MRTLALFATLAAAAVASAQEGLKPDTMAALKAASVYVRTQIEPRKFTGSGFVVAADAARLLVATNAHVVSLDEYGKLPAGEALPKLKAAKISVVFGSGGAAEQSVAAEVVAYDPAVDLALLRVKAADVKTPPKPLRLEAEKPLAETATVYTLGYPFGDALATGKGPAITVGKASVSSLRTDDAGKLSAIQIDGNLNPGNSGGPMVDADGGVIGVAVAVLRDSQGIGFGVPAAEVKALLAGKATLFRADLKKEGAGMKATVEALVANPEGTVTGLEVDYAVLAADAARPAADADVKKLPGAKTLKLTVTGAVAKGEFALEAATGQLVYAVRPVGPKAVAAPLTVVSLARVGKNGGVALDLDAKPPKGWKQAEMADKFVTVWVPEKAGKLAETSRNGLSGKLHYYFTALQTLGDNGVLYRVERANFHVTGIGASKQRLDTKALREAFVKGIAEEMKGKVTEESDAKLGTWPCKEYVIKGAGGTTAVVRVFVTGVSFYMVQARGPEAKVTGDDGAVFLNSFRTHPKEREPKEPDVAAGGTVPTPGATEKPHPPAGPTDKPATPPKADATQNKIAPTQTTAKVGPEGDSELLGGGGNDKAFRDYAPEGGVLTGFEVGSEVVVGRPIVTGVRPLFTVKGEEKEGEVHGRMPNAVSAKAKAGYAVGGLVVCKSSVVESLAVVFMKVLPNGQLDPKDAYESDWYGNPMGRRDYLVTGNGTPLLGVRGRTGGIVGIHLTGIGLMLNTPEAAKWRKLAEVGTPTVIKGGAFDPEFKDVAPDKALLVGIEFGLQKFVRNDVVRAFRPVYREGAKADTFGTQRGTVLTNVVKVVAKPGYAVGGITVKAGLTVDGLSVTFMKVKEDGTLDPSDNYESAWVGGPGGARLEKLGGDGTPIIGIVGKSNDKDATGFGLLKK